MYRDKKIGVVVPAYNEEPHIAAVLEGMPDFMDQVSVVDDGSTDRTADIVRGFCRGDGMPRPPSSDDTPIVESASTPSKDSRACPSRS